MSYQRLRTNRAFPTLCHLDASTITQNPNFHYKIEAVNLPALQSHVYKPP